MTWVDPIEADWEKDDDWWRASWNWSCRRDQGVPSGIAESHESLRAVVGDAPVAASLDPSRSACCWPTVVLASGSTALTTVGDGRGVRSSTSASCRAGVVAASPTTNDDRAADGVSIAAGEPSASVSTPSDDGDGGSGVPSACATESTTHVRPGKPSPWTDDRRRSWSDGLRSGL